MVLSRIIKNLKRHDMMHLITFHASPHVEFQEGVAADQKRLLAKIQALRVLRTTGTRPLSGSDPVEYDKTDIVAALQRAHFLLRTLGNANFRVRRLLFFSDGFASGGSSQHSAILEWVERLQFDGILTSAFAMGMDYERALLPAIAVAGRGDFLRLD